MPRRKFTCGVYCFKNLVSGKVYIGSSKQIEQRKLNHLCELRRNSHANRHLQRAFNRYGEENLQFVVLLECPEVELLGREQEYIGRYNATNREYGYNVWLTANRTIQSDEMRANLSKAHMGHKHPPEVRAKISAALRVRVRTAETRAKLSKALTGRKLSAATIAKRTASRQYKPLTEKHKQRIAEANRGRIVSTETRRKISTANYRGGRKVVQLQLELFHGGTWNKGRKMTAEARINMSRAHAGKERPWRQKSVIQMTKDGQVVATYPSIIAAAHATGALNIGPCCKGTWETSKGFRWRYAA